MSKQRFSNGTWFRWREATYEVKRLLPGEQVNIEDIFTGAVRVEELAVLVRALFVGELRFVAKGQQMDKPELEQEYLDLSDYPKELVSIARYRQGVILPLLDMKKRTRKAVQACVERAKAAKGHKQTLQSSVSIASIYRWINDYLSSGRDLRALIPNTHQRGGNGKTRLCPGVETLLNTVLQGKYYVREKVTIDDIRNELAVRIEEENNCREDKLVLPSRRTIARRINTQERFKARRGKRAAKRELTQYGKTKYPTQPLERVEIDHTKSDLIVIDDQDNLPLGRLTLTYCLDVTTRYPLGYYMGFEPPSYLAVMECLYHAICPKENIKEKYETEHDWQAYGIPSTLVIDNGREFIGHDLEDACLLLGIVLQQTPVRTPHFKAAVERMYGSLNTMLFHTLPGTTFSNIRERGDYDSVKKACVYLSDVDKMLNILLLDIYAERFHHGLNGIPARRWEELTKHGFAPGLPPNAKELSILLGRTTERVIQSHGIQFMSLRYNCKELVTLRTRLKKEKAKIKYHPADLSCVYVYDPFEQQYVQVPALDQEYTAELSLWKHRVIRQVVLTEQDRVDIVALGKAKRKIQQTVDEGRRRKRRRTHSRTARWDTAGKPTRQIKKKTVDPKADDKDLTLEAIPAVATTVMELTSQEDELSDTDWEISYTLTTNLEQDEGEEENGY